jgi:hypothetical protein
MIKIEGRAALLGELWFDEPIPEKPDVDIIAVHQRPAPVEGRDCTLFLTLVNDLKAAEDELYAAYGDNNRYKIGRARNRDQLEFTHVADPRAELDAFCAFYDAFAAQKGLPGAYRKGLRAAVDAGRLALTCATREGQVLVWHAYMTDGRSASLLHTASHFRGVDKSERAVIARANRWHHWRDMLAFKALGFERFCWGGVFEDESAPERANINNFKREFGGQLERNYNCTFAVTVRGRAAMAALRVVTALERFRARRAPRPAAA